LTASTIDGWLASWSRLHALLDEVSTRYIIATTTNTADTEAERGYTAYLDEIAPQAMAAEQRLKQKLIESGLEPQGFAVPLRKMRTEAGIYREANVPLLAEHRKLLLEYDRIAGVRMVQWEGEEIPLAQLEPVFYGDVDRGRRERAWRAWIGRVGQDTAVLADLWHRMIGARRQIAFNVG